MNHCLYLWRSDAYGESTATSHRPSPATFGLLAVVISFLTCSCSSHPPPSLAITHVTLIDATGAAPQTDMTIFLADEQIAAIGPSKSVFIPRKTKTLDGTGKFLLPGLVDMP